MVFYYESYSTLYTDYHLWFAIYSSADKQKNADKLNPCCFAFVVSRIFSTLVIDTSAVALVSPPTGCFCSFTVVSVTLLFDYLLSLSKPLKELDMFNPLLVFQFST